MADSVVSAAGWGLPEGLPPRALRVMSTASVVSLGTELGLQLDSPALTSATDERRRVLLTSLLAPALGVEAEDVSDLGILLVGPMARGAEVSLR